MVLTNNMTYEDVGFIMLISMYGWLEAVSAVRRARRLDHCMKTISYMKHKPMTV